MRKIFIFLIFLCYIASISAQTKRTIHVATAGSLSSYISESEKYQIEELTLTGEINGDDLGFLREMAGQTIIIWDGEFSPTDGKLRVLDMSEVRVVAGGGAYFINDDIGGDYVYCCLENDDEIPSYIFKQCSVLTTVIIPNSVTSIGYSAFQGCSGLTSVTIPNNVTFIGGLAFQFCSGLTSIVSEIENPFALNIYTFYNDIYATATLTVPAGTKALYQATAGWNQFKNIVETDGGGHSEEVRKFESGGITYIVNDNGTTVTVTAGNIKYNGDVSIPSSVSYNGKNYDVTSIGYAAFGDCTGLNSISIPNSVGYIQYGAFQNCSGLSSITLPNSIVSIAQYAFIGCSSLTKIISEIESPFSLEGSTFDNSTFNNATLIVPAGKKSLYQSKGGWKNFRNIVEAGGGSVIPNPPAPEGGTLIVEKDWTGGFSGDYPYWYGFDVDQDGSVTSHPDGIAISVPQMSDVIWYPQTIVVDSEIKLEENHNYIVRLIVKVPSDGTYQVVMGNWSYDDRKEVPVKGGNDFQIIDVNFSNYPYTIDGNGDKRYDTSLAHIRFMNGWVVGTTIINKIQVYEIRGSEQQGGKVGDKFEVDGIYYKIDDNNSVSVTRGDIKYSGNIVIPSKVTYKGKTYNVTAIWESAFQSSDLTSIDIPNSVTSIGFCAFYSCTALTSITIPNSLKTIEAEAFLCCNSLTSITIPNSVTKIGYDAFNTCSSLMSIVSEIQTPFAISNDVFRIGWQGDHIYNTATLTVPAGTKSLYQSTEGWKLFKNIVEVGETDMVEFTIDGVTYVGFKSAQTVMVKTVDTSLNSVEIPASVSYDGTSYTVTAIADKAFDGCSMAALIWNTDFALPNNAFNNAWIGSNFLLYVKSASYAPSTVKNVIANGTASTITLSDNGGNFYCPQTFTTQKISYSHQYHMETGGSGKGWETIALPFGVETITHATRGEIVPFAAYSQNSGKKPFWLCKFGSNGFVRTNSIQAYTPYIIAMPNQSNYDNNYILAGEVTFTSENVNVAATPTFSGTFVPAFSLVPKASNVYVLNVNNSYVSQSGGYDAGSRFISNLRDVRPFEAYISDISTRGVIEIGIGDGTTSMDNVLSLLNPDREIDIYTLSGQKVKRTKQNDIDNVMEQLPHGVYIVNGQKVLR